MSTSQVYLDKFVYVRKLKTCQRLFTLFVILRGVVQSRFGET